jgi:hypothetical protein
MAGCGFAGGALPADRSLRRGGAARAFDMRE